MDFSLFPSDNFGYFLTLVCCLSGLLATAVLAFVIWYFYKQRKKGRGRKKKRKKKKLI